jgi:hypothetical protein
MKCFSWADSGLSQRREMQGRHGSLPLALVVDALHSSTIGSFYVSIYPKKYKLQYSLNSGDSMMYPGAAV